MREPQIERAGRGEAGAEPATTALNGEALNGEALNGEALNGEQPEGLTGRAGLPPEVGVQARYERLAVTHTATLSQLPTLSIGFIDKTQSPLSRAALRRPALPGASRPADLRLPQRTCASQPVTAAN